MIHNLFSTPIYKVNILNDLKNINDIEKTVRTILSTSSNGNASLEKNGGVSTYETNNQLHTIDCMRELSNLVLFYSKMYWKILDIDERLSPRIDQCWSNIHYSKSFTLHHSHSLMPMVGTFYLKAEKNSGDLILTNPAEYSLTNIPFSKNIEEKIETSIKIKSGDLVFFPGYIRHRTGENFSNDERIVISFNIGYSGKYLSSNTDYPSIVNAAGAETSEIEQLYNKILTLEFIIENLKGAIANERKA
jgi:uncharacterized protein (TIGR02466 family)